MIYLNNSDLVASVVSSCDRLGENLDSLLLRLGDLVAVEADSVELDFLLDFIDRLRSVRSLVLKKSVALSALSDLGVV